MTQEFYINGGLADLPNDSVLALSFAVNTLFDVKTAQGNISNRLNLPVTPNNLKLLGFLNDMTIDLTQTIRKKITCRYLIDGVEIIPKGSIEIGDINSNAIGIVFTSGNLDFFDLIDSGSIQDLEFPELDHTLDIGTIPASRLNRTGYVYPIINYGDLTNASDHMNVRNMRPATFVKTIINKIVSETGYTIDDRLSLDNLAADQYARMILPFSNDEFTHSQRWVDSFTAYTMTARLMADTLFSFGTVPGSGFVTKIIPFSTITLDASGSFDGSTYTAAANFTAAVKAVFPRIDLIYNIDNGSAYFDFQIIKNGAVVFTKRQAPFGDTVPIDGSLYPITKSVFDTALNATVDLIAGDTIQIGCEVHEINVDNRQFKVFFPTDLSVTPVLSDVKWLDDVQIEATLPDITKKEFLKGIANIFCTIIQTDNDNKIVQFVPFRQIPANVNKAIDWSSKMVNPEAYTKNVSIGDYAQVNSANYKNDDVLNNDDYAKGVINIADENLSTNEKELFELPFSASYEDFILQGKNAVFIIKLALPTDTEFSVSVGPRICMVEFLDETVNYKDDIGAPSFTVIVADSVPFTYFKTDATGKPGMMFNQLLQRYYFEFGNLLNDQRMTTEQMLLTPMDIQNLDFFIPIYLAKYASYFYISKISSYVIGQPCNVNFIKLF